MTIRDEAQSMVSLLRAMRRDCVSLLAAGDVPARRIVDFIIDTNSRATQAQASWAVINGRGFSNTQKAALFQFVLDQDVPTNLPALLGAVKSTADALGPAYAAEVALVHGEVERSYNSGTNGWDAEVITKAARPNFEIAVAALRDAIDALTG